MTDNREAAPMAAGVLAEELEDVLRRNGFVRCDIAACNCGSWHARYGLPERMTELKELLADAGHPLCNANGNLVSRALQELIDERDRLASPSPAPQAPAGQESKWTEVDQWAEIWRLREAVKGPAGYASWQDAATDERIRRVKAESTIASMQAEATSDRQPTHREARLNAAFAKERAAEATSGARPALKPADPDRLHAGWDIKGEPIYLDGAAPVAAQGERDAQDAARYRYMKAKGYYAHPDDEAGIDKDIAAQRAQEGS